MEGKEKTSLVKKWWFWVCIVLIILIIGFVSIMMVGFSVATSGISKISLDIQNIYNDSTLYSSAGNSSLILELNHFKTKENSSELNKIISIIKNNLNGELQNYEKIIILSYIDGSDDKSNYLALKNIYSLPDFKEIEQRSYIDFDEYTSLFNTYDKTMDSYTGLFHSIY